MFKRTKIKIVASIMSILAALWIGSLGVIYSLSYLDMTRQNEQLLRTSSELYTLPVPEGMTGPYSPPATVSPRPDRGFADSPVFMLSNFFKVAISYDGVILDIESDPSSFYSDDYLKELALELASSGDVTGTKSNLSYFVSDKNGYRLVTFMDNTVVNENAMTLFRYTLIFGGIALVLFFFLSLFLASRIVGPLEQSHKRQKQFISDAGHELKTPVSVISANAELLSRELGENQWLINIQYENERMSSLVSQLLDLARYENVAPVMENIDFSNLVAGEALPFESVAFERGVSLTSRISEGIAVKGSNSQLRQVVSILLDNAIRHSEPSGEVYLHLTKERGNAVLRVINKGESIPEDKKEHIFERFYRLDEARTGEDKNYGLGLAIARAIAIAHKGKIDLSCHDGLIEFFITLPVYSSR